MKAGKLLWIKTNGVALTDNNLNPSLHKRNRLSLQQQVKAGAGDATPSKCYRINDIQSCGKENTVFSSTVYRAHQINCVFISQHLSQNRHALHQLFPYKLRGQIAARCV